MENYSKKSNNSFIFEIQEKEANNGPEIYVIKCINQKPLPSAEGFWNNTPIIFNENIYCLQNIPNESNPNSVYNDRRKILRFNFFNGWESIN